MEKNTTTPVCDADDGLHWELGVDLMPISGKRSQGRITIIFGFPNYLNGFYNTHRKIYNHECMVCVDSIQIRTVTLVVTLYWAELTQRIT